MTNCEICGQPDMVCVGDGNTTVHWCGNCGATVTDDGRKKTWDRPAYHNGRAKLVMACKYVLDYERVFERLAARRRLGESAADDWSEMILIREFLVKSAKEALAELEAAKQETP